MRKSTRLIKRFAALFLVVLMSIESFAAIVTDNDGSSFITKAEFDSLKNDFQSRVDGFSTSIDNKISNAVASYLSGVQTKGEKQTVGFLKDIEMQNVNDVVFKIGEELGTATTDQFSDDVKVVNPFVAVNGLWGWANNDPEGLWPAGTDKSTCQGYYEFDFYSHKPGNWSGSWDNTSAGCSVVALDIVKIGDNNYLAINDDYVVRKWQFQGVFAGQRENMGQYLLTTDTYPSSTIDFRGDKAFGTQENVQVGLSSGGAVVVTKVFSHRIMSETNVPRAASGAFFGVSDSTNYVYGWNDEKSYEFDTSKYKDEESSRECFRRREKIGYPNGWNHNDSPKFKYRINMPTQYKFKFDTLINKSASLTLGEPVRCYNGLPIIKADRKTTKIKLPLTISKFGSTDSKYKLYISDSPFDNAFAKDSANNILYKDNNFESVGDREITINFTTSKERVIWLKIYPEVDNDANVAFKVSLQKDERIVETLGG